jgi:hypothetical protein
MYDAGIVCVRAGAAGDNNGARKVVFHSFTDAAGQIPHFFHIILYSTSHFPASQGRHVNFYAHAVI